MIDVIEPGSLTLVQDGGRIGYGSHGVAPSGPFDPWAMRAANRIAGNPDRTAGLEMTLRGPALRMRSDVVIALAGGRFDASVDGELLPWGVAIRVPEGATVSVGVARDGARGVLAVRGGIDVTPVLGSRSTHVAAGLGPAPLRAGMSLGVGPSRDAPLRRLRKAPAQPALVRALAGPDAERFAMDPFFGEPYTVTTRADRTGVRLDGRALERTDRGEVDPQGLAAGAVQVPPDGIPIVLGPDRPITGGYPVVAVVIEADIGAIARARPGDTLRFARCSPVEARAAYAERERALDADIEDIP